VQTQVDKSLTLLSLTKSAASNIGPGRCRFELIQRRINGSSFSANRFNLLDVSALNEGRIGPNAS
jgi:hypothetical protein